MNSNNKQVGGAHYLKKIQHWDFISDNRIPYLIGNASKYITRWRDKNGREDLEKAIHYMEKTLEKGIATPHIPPITMQRFISQWDREDSHILACMFTGHYHEAINAIQLLIRETYDADDII